MRPIAKTRRRQAGAGSEVNVRQIVLDTETTGLDPEQGHRIIEIGCVELINRKQTENHFHQYINPHREIDQGAFEVHGISSEFLADKPEFSAIADDFVAFLKGAELVIHNAPFDLGFINAELAMLNKEVGRIEDYCEVVDTLVNARQLHPGQRNDLNSLCGRYEIDNSQRELHGALLDAEILAEVYLAMTGGQTAMLLDDTDAEAFVRHNRRQERVSQGSPLPVISPSDAELSAHGKWIELLENTTGERSVWGDIEGEVDS